MQKAVRHSPVLAATMASMSTLLVVRSTVDPADGPKIAGYFKEASKRAATTPGYRGGRLYVNHHDSSDYLILWHYQDVQAADAGLIAIAKGAALPQYQSSASPADVRRTHVTSVYGAASDGMPPGDYLSMSLRVAEPGYGKELASELEQIFGELMLLNGFCGWIVAPSDTLAEEIVGLCSWVSPTAFQTSIPTGILYEVRLYRRIA